MAEYMYDAFISYRHLPLDKAVAKKLHTLIETYHIPAAVQKVSGKKKMGKVFRDEEELPLAVSLSENIETALRGSEWLIVICTPALLQSNWCMREIDYYISLGRRDRILAVLADGTPDTSFPPQLRTLQTAQGIMQVEPLAANIVSESHSAAVKKLNGEKLRILAPMLSVSYDDLRRRARQRKIRTALIASAAGLAVLGAASAFLYASYKRNEAFKAQAAAEASRAEEERIRASEQESIAAEQESIAAEQESIAEEKRLEAAENNIGELLKKAEASVRSGEKPDAVKELLKALEISSSNGDMRREEILSLMRKALYTAPYTPVSSFHNQNIRMLNMVPSPDGKLAAGAANNNSAVVADIENNRILYQVSVSDKMINGLSFSSDGSKFMAQTENARSVTVWNTEDGSEAFRYTSKDDQDYMIANAFFLGKSDDLLIQDMAEFIRIRPDGTKKVIYTIGDQQAGYDPDNNILTMLSGRPISEMMTLSTDDYTGTSAAVSRDGNKILIGGRDGSTGVIIIDSAGNRICLLEDMPAAFSETFYLSPDASIAACVSYFGFFAAWDTDSGKLLYFYTIESDQGHSFSNIAFSPDGSEMAFVDNHVLYVMDSRTAELHYSGNFADSMYVPEVTYSADGKCLLVTDKDLILIDAKTGAVIRYDESEGTVPYDNVVPLSDKIFISRNDGSAWLYSTEASATVKRCDDYDKELYRDGQPGTVTEGSVILQSRHELTEGFLASTIYQGAELATSLHISSDGKTAALGYPDGVIEVFDTSEGSDGELLQMIAQLDNKISTILISHGKLIASDLYSGRILIYDLEKQDTDMIINGDYVYISFAMNPDGSIFAGLRDDTTMIDVYETATGDLLFSMQSSQIFTETVFSADGADVVGVTRSGYVVGDLLMDEAELLRRAEGF
ncbi:MAG: TIR domain-containing protein [Lachnospiraceae bacterium]|nr:TIR domain-containing protein [Lachnospiraceae bacterium]